MFYKQCFSLNHLRKFYRLISVFCELRRCFFLVSWPLLVVVSTVFNVMINFVYSGRILNCLIRWRALSIWPEIYSRMYRDPQRFRHVYEPSLTCHGVNRWSETDLHTTICHRSLSFPSKDLTHLDLTCGVGCVPMKVV